MRCATFVNLGLSLLAGTWRAPPPAPACFCIDFVRSGGRGTAEMCRRWHKREGENVADRNEMVSREKRKWDDSAWMMEGDRMRSTLKTWSKIKSNVFRAQPLSTPAISTFHTSLVHKVEGLKHFFWKIIPCFIGRAFYWSRMIPF